MPFVNIDAPGGAIDRRAVARIQKRHGSEARKAAVQARRDRRNAKRSSSDAILFYPWPAGGVALNDPDGAYVQGPSELGQIVVVGAAKGVPEVYAAAVSRWFCQKLAVDSATQLSASPKKDEDVVKSRGFLSIILKPAETV